MIVAYVNMNLKNLQTHHNFYERNNDKIKRGW